MPHFNDVRLTEKSSKALTDEAEHLVAPRLGLHRVGMRLVPLEQAVAVAAELEEVVVFLHRAATGVPWIGQLPSTSSDSV